MTRLALWLVPALLAAGAGGAAGQSALAHSPNVDGGWVGSAGRAHFNFLHRFTVSDPPARKVSNTPTFLMAVGLPHHLLVGARYATNSRLVAGVPNEWEFFGRVAPLREPTSPVQLAVHAGYNLAAESVDGEVTVARALGPVRLLGAGRAFSNAFDQGDARYALAAGASLRLTRWLALAGDVGSLLDRKGDEEAAWSAGLQLQIPYTPHTLSLHATNTDTGTLEGASLGDGTTRYGFTFNVPITLRRYFGRAAARSGGEGRGGGSDAVAQAPANEAVNAERRQSGPAADTIRADIAGLKYLPAELEVAVGATIVWTNRDPLAHTVTADDGAWDSDLIQPGESWSHTFTQAGEYSFHCTPHPFMTGTIVVGDAMEGP